MCKDKLPSPQMVRKQLFSDWSLRVRQRDKFRCALCGNEDNLTVHHWFCASHHAHAARFCEHNGVCLCYTCHIRTIHSRADWMSLKPLADIMWRILPANAEDTITHLCKVELTIPLLRALWNEMRERTLDCEGYSTCAKYKGGKLFFTVKHKRPIAVVGNVLRLGGWGLQEVAVVAPTEDGFFRYTLRRVKEQ